MELTNSNVLFACLKQHPRYQEATDTGEQTNDIMDRRFVEMEERLKKNNLRDGEPPKGEPSFETKR